MSKKDEQAERRLSLLTRENRRLRNQTLDDMRLVEKLRDAISILPPPPKYKVRRGRKSTKEQEVVMLFSDAQLGERIEAQETGKIGGTQGYDIDVFADRLDYWTYKVIKVVESHRGITPIRHGHIFSLGDVLEGRQIFRGQSARVTDSVMMQFMKGLDLIAVSFRDIAGHFEELTIDWALGNHGRVGMKDEELHYVNWEFLFAQLLKEKLKDCPNIKWNIPKSWWMVVPIKGWKFYLTHGDDLVRYMGVPWYSLERMDGKVTLMLQEQDIKFDYIVMGHHHQSIQWDRPWGERIVNGSFSAGNPFAAKKLQLSTRPTQTMFGVHPEHGISWRYLIRLDRIKRR